MISDSRDYAKALEKRLIDDFKGRFYEKLGYYPMVITKVVKDHNGYIPVMGLDTLSGYFKPHYPEVHGRVLDLKSKRRYRPIVNLRMMFCTMARQMGHTAKSIGDYLGGRDHTTVLHNTGQAANLMEYNDDFKEKYLTILTQIKNDYADESATLEYFTEVLPNSEPALLT